MAHRFVHCAGRIELTDEQIEALRGVDTQQEFEDDFVRPQWCELANGHDGVPHYSEVVSIYKGDHWWLRWDKYGVNELVRLESCPVDSGPVDDIDSSACGLFLGHPGRHGWAEQDPEMCTHTGAGKPHLLSEAVAFDGRYVNVFEARCLGCSQQMVRVVITDPQQAPPPPQHFGTRASTWSFLRLES